MSKTILFIGAHPDDIEIGCGGTVAKMVSENNRCVFIIATNGDQGSIEFSQQELAAIRKKESIASAKVLGVNEVHFLDLADGLTHYELEDKLRLIKLIRDIKPDVAFIHSSTDHHPDHVLIHKLALSALKSATGPWFPAAGKNPHEVKEIYGYEVWNTINNVQLVIDISPYIKMKLKALAEHKSQVKDFPYMDAVAGLNQYRGAIAGGGQAEVFEVFKTQL